MEQIQIFKVGQTVPYPFNTANVQDGAILTLDAEGAACLGIYFGGMTKEEALAIRKKPISTAAVSEPPYWLGAIKIGPVICELEYDPMRDVKRGQPFSADFFRENSLVTILGIDSRDMNLRALRAATYPPKLLRSLFEAYSEFTPDEKYSMGYQTFLFRHRKGTIEDLWQKMTKTGAFGEK